MFTLKWAWAAIAIEVGVFLSPLLHQSTLGALLAMLALHALASAIVASGSYVLLPHKYMRPRVTVWLLLFLFAFVAPLIGAVGMLAIIWTTFRKESLDGDRPEPVTVPLPEFDMQAKDVSRSGQGSIRSRLNSHVPSAIRLQSLMTLQAIPTRVANPILDELLSDNSDDVRLVAFGMLDAEEKKITLRAFIDEAGKIIIEVSDTGKGIEEEALGKIFIPFFTTKKKGSGIGLSLSKQIMRRHKGNIQVRSKLGEGTTFKLIFNG